MDTNLIQPEDDAKNTQNTHKTMMIEDPELEPAKYNRTLDIIIRVVVGIIGLSVITILGLMIILSLFNTNKNISESELDYGNSSQSMPPTTATSTLDRHDITDRRTTFPKEH